MPGFWILWSVKFCLPFGEGEWVRRVVGIGGGGMVREGCMGGEMLLPLLLCMACISIIHINVLYVIYLSRFVYTYESKPG